MSGIRKQAIVSSILVYIGVAIGVVNTYFFVKEGTFTQAQYGLTRIFFDVGQNFFVFASLGVIPVIYKFYPYYRDNLADHEIDLLGRTFATAAVGFLLVAIAGIFIEPLIIQKFSARSKLFVDYYFWVFPFAFGLLAFSLLEGYAWALQKTVLPNFLKETGLRFFTFIFIVLFYFHYISFHSFMMLFSLMYIMIALWLLVALIRSGKFHFNFRKSRVTKKFRSKMLSMQLLMFGGICVTTIGQTVDGLIIASLKGLADTSIYTFALYLANLIQIPQRSIQSISVGVLVREWKNKNVAEIQRIYQRSSINMLLIALFIFCNVWLNATDGFHVLNIKEEFAQGLSALFVFGIIRIIDAGTGVNGQIIGASNFWRFEFLTGVILIGIRIPLSYIFVKQYGIIGTAYSDLISLTVYNFTRYEFLRRKFGMQPFSIKTIYSLLLALFAYFAAYYLFRNMQGWLAIFSRSFLFSAIMITGVFTMKLTPDAMQLYDVVMKRLKGKKE